MRLPLHFPPREILFSRLVLIYQMPKIGSQTIEATLCHYSFPYPIRRFHYLSSTIARTVRKGVASSKPDPAWKKDAQFQLDLSKEVIQLLRLRRLLCRFGFGMPKVEVITGVRELIGMVLSSIFENYLYFVPTIDALTVDRCREALLHPKTFKNLRNWFDLELKKFTRIDVFSRPFPIDQGFSIYENRFARVLVYRFECLDRLSGLLQDFLSWKIPALINSNVGSEKLYAKQYRSVRENLRLPVDFVKSLYDDSMMRHFFSQEERQNLLLKWTGIPGHAPAISDQKQRA